MNKGKTGVVLGCEVVNVRCVVYCKRVLTSVCLRGY